MKLSSVEIQGFRGIKEKVIVNFGSGFTVINGRNGTGKSTICDAVEFALTGRIRSNSISEKGENILDYIWWCGKGKPTNHFVKLILVSPDGKRHEVFRTRDGLQSDTGFEKLLVNAELAPSDPLNQLIKVNIIRDEEITQTSVDLKEKDRFNFVRNTIGMENLDEYEYKAKELNKRVGELIKNITSKYEDQRGRITELTVDASEIKAESLSEKVTYEAESTIKKYLEKKNFTKSDLIRLANEKTAELIGTRNIVKEIITESNSLSNQLKTIETQEFISKVKEKELIISKTKEEIKKLHYRTR